MFFFFYVTINTKPFSLSINLQRLRCFWAPLAHFIPTLIKLERKRNVFWLDRDTKLLFSNTLLLQTLK